MAANPVGQSKSATATEQPKVQPLPEKAFGNGSITKWPDLSIASKCTTLCTRLPPACCDTARSGEKSWIKLPHCVRPIFRTEDEECQCRSQLSRMPIEFCSLR